MLTDDEKRKLKSLQVTHTIGSPRSTDSQDWASSGLLLKAEEHQNNITVYHLTSPTAAMMFFDYMRHCPTNTRWTVDASTVIAEHDCKGWRRRPPLSAEDKGALLNTRYYDDENR